MAARNYSEIVEYIKTHPKQAIILIAQWQDVAKKNPILSAIQTAEEWYLKAEENSLDPSLWIAREIMDIYPEVRNTYPETKDYLPEKPKQNLQHHVSGFMALPFLPALFSKPNFMEDDLQYQSIVSRLKDDYKESLRKKREKETPGRKIKISDADPQLLDYIYGPLDEKPITNLRQDAEKRFREGSDIAEKDPVKKAKKMVKRQKEVERYDKIKERIYKKASSDPFVIRLREKIAEHARVRCDLYQRGLKSSQDKKQGQQKLNEIAKTVEEKEWEEFVVQNPQKAAKYSQETKGEYVRKIKAAVERNKQKGTQPETLEQQPPAPPAGPIISRPAPQPLFQQITRRFLTKEQKAERETRPVQKPSVATRIRRIFVPPGQTQSQTQKPPSGIQQALDRSKTGRFINRTNKFINRYSPSNVKKQARKRINKFLKSLGKKALGRIATTLAPFLLNPVIIVISFVIIFTFIILLASYGMIFTGLGINWGDFGGNEGTKVETSKDLDYFIPFRDKSVFQKDIKSPILSSWPNARIENWEIIISQSIQNSWNPAFVLALWIEETGAQGVSSYSDPLGCDPSKPTTDINISLKCLFDSFNLYTNSQFADFMCMYSESKKSPCVFNTNPNFPKNIKYWYSQLVPDGSGALVKFTPTPPTNGKGTPPPVNQQQLREEIIKKFGIAMDGFNTEQLQWAWEKLWDISSTEFINLANGAIITKTTSISEQLGCKAVRLRPPSTKEAFNVVLLHELGHIVYWCNQDPISKRSEHARIFNLEGGITGYAQHACFGTPPVNEDYAESHAYYLNPNTPEVIECNRRNQIPFANGKYPMHFNLVKSILGNY